MYTCSNQKLFSHLFITALIILSLISGNTLYADTDRAKRPFARIKSPKVGLNVPVPARPEWNHSIEPRAGTYALLVSTPEKFYPQVSMEIVLNHRLKVNPTKLENTALIALNTVREKAGLSEKVTKSGLKPVTYGDIQGYQDSYQLKLEGQAYSVKSIMGIMPSGHPITIFLATPEGQMKHIEDITHKMWKNIKELPEVNGVSK
jgi:hypothetical protein